jgi:hypothetical protein
MAKRSHRTQTTELVPDDDLRPLVVKPLEGLDDRRRNPRDIDPDLAAMRNGITHGGTIDNRAAALAPRGAGGRKRSGAYGRSRPGRDISKRR